VTSLHGDLVRNPPAETNPSVWRTQKGLTNRTASDLHKLEAEGNVEESAFHRRDDYSPNGVSLEAVGAPGEQLADAVQVAAARGQMQRRAPGESEGRRARVKCYGFPQKERILFVSHKKFVCLWP
jgi:hypothetical protein